MSGAQAIVWKEWRELLLPNGRPGKQLLGMIGIQLAMPWFFLLMLGDVPEAYAIFIGAFLGTVPLFTVISFVIDSFAGERERHTLETLLATQLSDRQILFGKLLAMLTFAIFFSVIGLLVLVLVGPILLGYGPLFLLSLTTFASTAVAIFHLSALASLAGILISMRVKTVRAGQQIFAFAIIVPMMLLPTVITPLFATQTLDPEAFVAALPIIAIGAGILVYGLMGILFWIALRLFRRDRLLAR